MNQEFNKDAMEQKIYDNIQRGFTIKDIYKLLCEEFLECRKKVLVYEQRSVELQDQIKYMKNKYNKELEK